jgi:hypothetical protein
VTRPPVDTVDHARMRRITATIILTLAVVIAAALAFQATHHQGGGQLPMDSGTPSIVTTLGTSP